MNAPLPWSWPLRRILAAFLAVISLTAVGVAAQPTGLSPLNPPPNSPRRADSTWHALTNATVHVRPGQVLNNATIVFRDGIILSVLAGENGRAVDVPPTAAGARIWDATGLHIYPGFIDAHVEVNAPTPDADAPGAHWNTRVMPQRSALDGTGVDNRTAESLRKLGFTAAAIVPRGGVFRGTGAVVSLAKPASEQSADRPPVYRERVFQGIAFDTGRRGRGDTPDLRRWSSYPNSQMGAIALIRQTLIDADWQVEARRSGAAIAVNSLDHLAAAPVRMVAAGEQDSGVDVPRALPLLFDTDDELEALRAAKIAREFERPAVILGSGNEFRRLDAIANDNLPIVLPLTFPRAPDVSSVGRAESAELRDLMTWEQAPTNPRRLDDAGLKVALTTSKLRNRSEFEANLTRAIKHGLAPDRALAMLTTQPAELLGVADRVGTIEVGKVASFVVAEGSLFAGFTETSDAESSENAESNKDAESSKNAESEDEKRSGGETRTGRAKIRDVWIDGYRHEITAAPVTDHVGTWHTAIINGRNVDPAAPEAKRLTISSRNQITYRHDGKDVRATNVRVQGNRINYTIEGTIFGVDAVLLAAAVVEGDALHGTIPMPDGALFRWTARRETGAAPEEQKQAQPAPIEHEAPAAATFVGTWHLVLDDQPDEEVTIDIHADHSVEVFIGGQRLAGQDVLISDNTLSFRFDGSLIGFEGVVQVDAVRDGESMTGTADIPGLDVVIFAATRDAESKPQVEVADVRAPARPRARPAGHDAEKNERDAIAQIPKKYGYPFGPYMVMNPPAQSAKLFINATLWTAGPEGIIENGWMFIRDGKIVAIGKDGPPDRFGEAEVIDAGGRHIAPGIIDCHSHTGISKGVNESGHAVTSEVRMSDVTNPDAISWYRQLASGVTAVNTLHGSANAIGGQSQTNKIRWGAQHPDDMHMEGAKPGIKFALGENVKQSNSGDRNTVRYPQTRMGVETLMRDRFKAAREYAWHLGGERSQNLGETPIMGNLFAKLPLRRDLELEALAEILAGERLVHCHSYRQDEILMLCRIAGEFNFKIGTFQHILEGYKVADEIARHAIGASAFSDWWAFKVEVQDAIPQGGPIMWEEGVVVSFNSDSDELARRMNGEAAKAVKYSSPDRPIDQHEAIKFVTLNPAIQLGVGDRIGSLEVGKDADFAIWSGSPLSSMSRCEATYIDGRRYFSLEDDRKHREAIQEERQRLIQKILSENRRRPGTMRGREDREETARMAGDDSPRRGMMRARYLDMINRGIDPSAARPGDCGCDELEFHMH